MVRHEKNSRLAGRETTETNRPIPWVCCAMLQTGVNVWWRRKAVSNAWRTNRKRDTTSHRDARTARNSGVSPRRQRSSTMSGRSFVLDRPMYPVAAAASRRHQRRRTPGASPSRRRRWRTSRRRRGVERQHLLDADQIGARSSTVLLAASHALMSTPSSTRNSQTAAWPAATARCSGLSARGVPPSPSASGRRRSRTAHTPMSRPCRRAYSWCASYPSGRQPGAETEARCRRPRCAGTPRHWGRGAVRRRLWSDAFGSSPSSSSHSTQLAWPHSAADTKIVARLV